jgi:hypothetical protein
MTKDSGTGDFALWLAATTVVTTSLNKSGVVTELTYEFKCGRHFLKTILTSKSLI